jgi:hypothetical protein
MVTRNARLESFITDGWPSPGLQVQALAEDHVGTYALPFPCERVDEGWRNATTGEAVQARIIGWRELRAGSRDRPPSLDPQSDQSS